MLLNQAERFTAIRRWALTTLACLKGCKALLLGQEDAARRWLSDGARWSRQSGMRPRGASARWALAQLDHDEQAAEAALLEIRELGWTREAHVAAAICPGPWSPFATG